MTWARARDVELGSADESWRAPSLVIGVRCGQRAAVEIGVNNVVPV